MKTLALLALSCVCWLGCGADDAPAGAAGAGGLGGAAGAAGSAGAGGGPLSLAPGEVAEVELDSGSLSLELATPSGEERFVLVLASLDLGSATTFYDYAPASSAEASASAALVTGCTLDDAQWKDAPLSSETPPSATGAVQPGDQRSVTVPSPTGPKTITVEALAVGSHAIVWGDVTPAAPAVIDAAVVTEFLTDFEQIILPRARAVFGVESDQDGDGRIGLVFSPITHQTAVAFFSSCDLGVSLGCASSNQGEYLYLTPPNAIPPPYNTPNAIKEILAHELSHMIHYHRKVKRNSLLGWNESSYSIEGVGALAQDVLGYQSGNLYVTMAGLDGIDSFSLADVTIDGTKYDPPRDGALRGASYLFVRWLYDRAGGDLATSAGIESRGGPALLRTLLDAPESLTGALPSATGKSAPELAMDFWTTLALSNRDVLGDAAPTNNCFAFLPTVSDPVTGRQRGTNTFASFHGQQMKGPKLQPFDATSGKLRSGGAEFLSLDAVPGAPTRAVGLTVDAAAMPRLRVARVH